MSASPPYLSAGPNPIQGGRVRQCACCPPANMPRHNDDYHYHFKRDYPGDTREEPHRYQQSRYDRTIPVPLVKDIQTF